MTIVEKIKQEIRAQFEAYKKTEAEAFANSAGGHALSRKAKNILEDSRDNIAGHFGAAPKEITFTSGGTEADNWIITGREVGLIQV